MKKWLIISLFGLWYYNTEICTYYYPDFQESMKEWDKWYYLRCKIYEVMFLIAFLFPVFKSTRLSKALTITSGFIVACSVVDKWQGVFDFHPHDYIVNISGVLVGLIYYHQWKLKHFFTVK